MALISCSPRPAAPIGRSGSLLIVVLAALAAVALQAAPARAAASDPAVVEQTTVVLNGGEQRGVAVHCPNDTRVTGGGVGTFGSVDSKILVSGPLDETGLTANTDSGDIARYWYAAVYNRGATPRAYRVFAMCSAISDAFVAAKTINVAAGSTQVSGFTMCPIGTRVVGGGIGTTHPVIDRPNLRDAAWQLMHSGPLDGTGSTAGTTTGDVGVFWYAALRKFSDGPADVYKVFALCSRDSDATVVASSMTVPAHSARDGAPNCASDKVIVGGGIGTPATPVDDYLQLSGPLNRTGLTENTLDGDLGVYWYGNVFNNSGSAREYKVFALCASFPIIL